MILRRFNLLLFSAALALLSVTGIRAQADKLIVTHYAGALNGLPYTIALEKGYFKDARVNITGIIGGAGAAAACAAFWQEVRCTRESRFRLRSPRRGHSKDTTRQRMRPRMVPKSEIFQSPQLR
jgi:hypothetical protein